MRVMPRKGQERELAVQEDNGIAILEEVFGAGGSARTGREVVDVADCLLF